MASQGVFPRAQVQQWLESRLAEVRQSGQGQLLAIRGRRQAGKSTAVEHFAESADVPYVYVTGLYRRPEPAQLEAAGAAFAASRHPWPAGVIGPPGSWQEWFGQIALAASSGPVIAVLDEFPWLAAGDQSGLEGVIQATWDRVLEKLPVLMILIGSDLAMMERLTGYDRPLFGRVREHVVPPLNPAEVAAVADGRTPFEVFDAYLVTGGFPRLVADLRRSGLAVGEWVRRSFEDDLSPLVATGRLTLDAEFADGEAAYRVLSAIGSAEPARLGLGEISGATATAGTTPKAAQTAALRALGQLADAKRLVERELPAWATSTRLRRYRITDPYLRFWFRYVERHVDAISRGRGDVAVAAFERDWPSWRGRTVEPVVREALERLGATDSRLTDVETVLPWWTRDGQVEVDVAAASRERTEMLGTIKWREAGGVSTREILDLAAMRTRVPCAKEAALAAICPSGAAPAGADHAFSAADLLTAWR